MYCSYRILSLLNLLIKNNYVWAKSGGKSILRDFLPFCFVEKFDGNGTFDIVIMLLSSNLSLESSTSNYLWMTDDRVMYGTGIFH